MNRTTEIKKWREPVYIDITLFGLAYGAIIISGLIAYKTNDPSWFSSSGSLMVIFSGALEFRQSRVQQRRNEIATKGSGTFGGGVAPLELPIYRQRIIWASHVSLILGTLVWGYGDKVFSIFI